MYTQLGSAPKRARGIYERITWEHPHAIGARFASRSAGERAPRDGAGWANRMRHVTLAGTPDIATSTLGFGCASLGRGGRRSTREKLRLLEEAWDAGITHFDTARVYGLGEAERVLGRFLARHRDQVTVTTKLGLVPPRRSPALAAARAAARRVVALAPRIGDPLLRGAGRLVQGGRFSATDAAASLDASLRELGTDHVDVLLLHECSPLDASREDLLEFLSRCLVDGRARAVGLATDHRSTLEILGRPGPWNVAQVAASVLDPEPTVSIVALARCTITHSVLASDLDRLRTALASQPGLARELGGALDADPLDRDALAGGLLRCACRANPSGILLFASGRSRAIRANAAAVEVSDAPGQAEADEAFLTLARRAVEPTVSPR